MYWLRISAKEICVSYKKLWMNRKFEQKWKKKYIPSSVETAQKQLTEKMKIEIKIKSMCSHWSEPCIHWLI